MINSIGMGKKLMISSLELCKHGEAYFKGSCYQMISKCQPYSLANAHCLVKGASLLVIDSVDEAQFVQERIKTASWLNLQKTSPSPSSWQWGNGNSVNYTNWILGQPANLPNHNCAVIDNQGTEIGWKVEDCSACRNTLCETGIV